MEPTSAKGSPRSPELRHAQSLAYDVINSIYEQDRRQIEREVQDLSELIRHNPKTVDMCEVKPRLLERIMQRGTVHNSLSFWADDNHAPSQKLPTLPAQSPVRLRRLRAPPQTDSKRPVPQPRYSVASKLPSARGQSNSRNRSAIQGVSRSQDHASSYCEDSAASPRTKAPRSMQAHIVSCPRPTSISAPRQRSTGGNFAALESLRQRRPSRELRRRMIHLGRLFTQVSSEPRKEAKQAKIGMLLEEYRRARNQRTRELMKDIDVTDAHVLPSLYDYKLQTTLNHEAETYRLVKDFRVMLEDSQREVAKIERDTILQRKIKRIMLQHRRTLKS